MITSTTDKELQGDGQDVRLESFSKCKHLADNEPSPYSMVSHSCKYCDMYNNCTRDSCLFDKEESPDIAHKFWVTCIFCRDPFVIDPKQMDVPICGKCRQILANHLKLPFTCAKCGRAVNEYTAMPFTKLCPDCLKNLVFNDACARYLPAGPVDLIPLDLP